MLLLLLLALLFIIAFSGLAVFVAKVFFVGILIVIVLAALGGYSLRGKI
jgi:hypothetical protein